MDISIDPLFRDLSDTIVEQTIHMARLPGIIGTSSHPHQALQLLGNHSSLRLDESHRTQESLLRFCHDKRYLYPGCAWTQFGKDVKRRV